MAGAWLARLLPRKPEFGDGRKLRKTESGHGRGSREAAIGDGRRQSRGGRLSAGGEAQLVIRWCMLMWLSVTAHLADTSKHDGCMFPPRWSGKWFQSGVIQPIVIEGDRQSNKGRCLSSEGDKFIIVDEKGCYRCVVMHEKHINVLQYKETFCHTRDALPHLCSMITGDALLYSMFRENAAPVSCPLKGPFSFTYNRGHGDCKSPVSSIESCTEESRLLLNYQACPDVYGSESTVEELECLATWKEGSLRFLVGKVHHNHATSNEDRYRCFVYEKTNGLGSTSINKDTADGVEYRVAQSGDATCNGLFSATEGSRTMALKRVPTQWKCRFPTWMTFSGHWHTLDYTSMYSFHQKNATLRITNQTGADIKVHCVQVKASSQTGNSVLLVAHWQHHCVSHFVCVLLYRRDAHVAELQRGAPTLRADDACLPEYFNAKEAPYVTLVTSNPASRKCPFPGKFDITSIKYRQRNVRSLNHINDSSERRKYEYKHHKGKKRFEAERRRRRYEKRLREVLMRETQKNQDAHSIYDIYMNFNKTKSTNKAPNSLKKRSLVRMRRSDLQNEGSAQCAASNFNALDIGCNIPENLEFHSVCENKDVVTAYSCHGGWYEDGTSFLIVTPLTRDSIGARRSCFLSREAAHGSIHFTRSSVNCDRSLRPGIDGALVFNTSRTGGCQVTSSSSKRQYNTYKITLIFIITYLSLYNIQR